MIKLSELTGQQAVSLRTAEKTGSVRKIAVEGNHIVAVELSDSTIPASAVRSFEGDVLTYDDQQTVDDGLVTIDPRGMRVLDMHGDLLGTIGDLSITADGTIDTIHLSDGQAVPGARLRAIGTYAAVLTNELPPPTGAPVG